MNIQDDPALDKLTSIEQEIVDSLPGPPPISRIVSTNLWIIEWLPLQEQRTGQQLYKWANMIRPKWSRYCLCHSKCEVINAIREATSYTRSNHRAPILHIEAHGAKAGLEGPCGQGLEFLTWPELCVPLQELNVATNCNLLVFIAACTGFAGIGAFYQGPYAPAVALAGPDSTVIPGELLQITKEFYRRLMDENASLTDMATSASRESASVVIEWEPFPVLAFEAFAKNLVLELRRLSTEIALPQSEISRQIDSIDLTQRIWDKLFLIDQNPNNAERFGVNWEVVQKSAISALSRLQ